MAVMLFLFLVVQVPVVMARRVFLSSPFLSFLPRNSSYALHLTLIPISLLSRTPPSRMTPARIIQPQNQDGHILRLSSPQSSHLGRTASEIESCRRRASMIGSGSGGTKKKTAHERKTRRRPRTRPLGIACVLERNRLRLLGCGLRVLDRLQRQQ